MEQKPVSYKPEVSTDSSGIFYSNALAFATHEEALDNARDLAGRWMLVRDYRAVESTEPVNYAYVDGKLVDLKVAA